MKKITVLFLVGLFISLNTGISLAKPSDKLTPLLVDIAGFEADEAYGETMDMIPGMKVINASRSYEADAGTVDATILIGTNAMVQSQAMAQNAETAEAKVETITVKGFSVIHAMNKVDNSGNFVVALKKGTNEGAMFMIAYSGISKDKALNILEKFDLKKMEELTSSMMS